MMTTAIKTEAMSKQVHEPELAAEDLERVIGGWSVSVLSQMGGGGREKAYDYSITKYLDAASP